MDFSELTLGEKILIIGGAGALVATFLKWYSLPTEVYGFAYAGPGGNVSLWTMHGFAAFLMLGGSVVAAGLILLRLFGVFDINDQNVPEELVVLIAGGCVVAGALWGFASTNGWNRSYGMWLGIAAAVAVVAGAVMKFQEERA